MDLEGLRRAPGWEVASEGVCYLGTQSRILLALCPNAHYFIWFESFKSDTGEESVHR